jgi:hypothetical protein
MQLRSVKMSTPAPNSTLVNVTSAQPAYLSVALTPASPFGQSAVFDVTPLILTTSSTGTGVNNAYSQVAGTGQLSFNQNIVTGVVTSGPISAAIVGNTLNIAAQTPTSTFVAQSGIEGPITIVTATNVTGLLSGATVHGAATVDPTGTIATLPGGPQYSANFTAGSITCSAAGIYSATFTFVDTTANLPIGTPITVNSLGGSAITSVPPVQATFQSSTPSTIAVYVSNITGPTGATYTITNASCTIGTL